MRTQCERIRRACYRASQSHRFFDADRMQGRCAVGMQVQRSEDLSTTHWVQLAPSEYSVPPVIKITGDFAPGCSLARQNA
jgi:hypothetical protein